VASVWMALAQPVLNGGEDVLSSTDVLSDLFKGGGTSVIARSQLPPLFVPSVSCTFHEQDIFPLA
jgi:hypothetical protein